MTRPDITVAKADFDLDRRRWIALSSSTQTVMVVRTDGSVSAVFGGLGGAASEPRIRCCTCGAWTELFGEECGQLCVTCEREVDAYDALVPEVKP